VYDGVASRVEEHLRDTPTVAAADGRSGGSAAIRQPLLGCQGSTAVQTDYTRSRSE
jgi:hypothetical protein